MCLCKLCKSSRSRGCLGQENARTGKEREQGRNGRVRPRAFIMSISYDFIPTCPDTYREGLGWWKGQRGAHFYSSWGSSGGILGLCGVCSSIAGWAAQLWQCSAACCLNVAALSREVIAMWEGSWAFELHSLCRSVPFCVPLCVVCQHFCM